MIKNIDFEDIRPYRDHEFEEVVDRLLTRDEVVHMIGAIFPKEEVAGVITKLRGLKTIRKFQETVICDILTLLLKTTSKGISYSGLDKLDKDKSYLFVSNHRDIVLDSAFLNYILVNEGFDTAEIAIGNNLLSSKLMEDLVRINKSFIVKRNLPPRQLIMASRQLSSYILDTIMNRGQSVWIAQREGRAKDGNDKTQAGLVNMLGLAAGTDLIGHYKSLNIVPVSISYEEDPCDVEKALAVYAERYEGGYKKSEGEDMLAMKKGMIGQKGKINFSFGTCISDEIDAYPGNLHKSELVDMICGSIDTQIISNYKLYRNNYISHDVLNNTSRFSSCYNFSEKDDFTRLVEKKVASVKSVFAGVENILYEMYAMPVINKLKKGML